MLAQGAEGASGIVAASAQTEAGVSQLIAIVPSNVISAMSENDILAVMFFALFFGIGLLLVQTRRTETLKDAIEGVFEVSMRLLRSEERRGGKECVSTFRSRWSP